MNSLYIDLSLALLIWFSGYFWTGKYVKPRWKITGKFVIYMFVSFLLAWHWGHWSLIFIIGHQFLGHVFHIIACRKHGINWLTCQPRDQYLALHDKWGRREAGSEP